MVLGKFLLPTPSTSNFVRISLDNNYGACIQMIGVDLSSIGADKPVDLQFISLFLFVFLFDWVCTCIYFDLMFICLPWNYIKLDLQIFVDCYP